jgi:transposase
MWFKASISLGVVLAFGAGLWWVKSRLDLLQSTQTRLAQVEQMLIQSRNEITAMREAAKLDAQENVQGFEKADWACQQTVKQAVAGTRVKPIPAQEIIKYVEVEVGNSDCPSVRLPDFFRMRDIQEAGTDPD